MSRIENLNNKDTQKGEKQKRENRQIKRAAKNVNQLQLIDFVF